MADRQVTHSKKSQDGDILALCQPGQDWSPRWKSGAIGDIENGSHRYYVFDGVNSVLIRVVNGANGKYLRTDPDQTKLNNLDYLPDC